MFSRKILISTLAVFATTMTFGFIVFGILLQDFFIANTGDMVVLPQGEERMEWLTIAELILAYAFVWIWQHGVKDGGTSEGLRFGFFMGLFWATVEMFNYAFLPMGMTLMFVGFVLDIVMFMLAGAVLSMVWAKLAD